ATGPADMISRIQYLSHQWPKRVSCIPNQGLPQVVNGKTHYPMTPEEYAKLETEAREPFSVRAMLESKDEADARALMLFWALATSPYSANAKLSQGKISGADLCKADEWTARQCADAKARVAAAAAVAGAFTMLP
ncbi:MAG: homocysteine S-methyltransferase family protein, partial [Gemmatimonadales bacterium]